MKANIITNGRFLASTILMGGALMCFSASAQTTKTTTATKAAATTTTATTTAATSAAATATAVATKTAADQTAEAQAKVLTDKMKTSLGLTDEQYPLVYDVNLKYLKKNASTTSKTSSRLAKLKAVQTTATNKENEMKAILTEEQFQKYQGVKDKVKTTAIEKLKKFKF